MFEVRLIASDTIQISGPNKILTSVEVPAAARTGDLVVLTMLGPVVEDVRGQVGNKFINPALFDDSRLQRMDPGSFFEYPWQEGMRTYSVWSTTHNGDRTPYGIKSPGFNTIDTTLGQFAIIKVDVFREINGAGLEIDPGRGNWSLNLHEDVPPPPAPTPPFNVPEALGRGPAAIAITGAWAGILGLGGKVDFGSPLGSPGIFPGFAKYWKIAGSVYGTGGYLDVYSAISTAPVVPSTPMPFNTEVGWVSTIFGVRAIAPPVTRQYPRDDGLGLSSASRLFPPVRGPVGGRRVGGHQ